MQFIQLGQSPAQVARAFRSFNGYAPALRAASNEFEKME
jgi:hypothetical protein